jgi:[protein-PII] uridylyltransferase
VVARELDRMQLNVLAARVLTTDDGMSWDLFQVMDANSQPLHDSDAGRLERALREQLAVREVRSLPPRPVPRRLQPFMGRSEIRLSTTGRSTELEIAATDRPGLLSAIAEALVSQGLRLHDARVATFGQRVEDLFTITTGDGGPLDRSACDALEVELRERLDVD